MSYLSKKLCSWDGLWIHSVLLDRFPHLRESVFEQREEGCFARPAGPNDDDSHALLKLFIELNGLVHLQSKIY